ncbi:MAG: TraB/GumN family protein [Xanthomonadales bacterium]|nr:TraB/GumN family protein [Xanthomonadales bacterium]
MNMTSENTNQEPIKIIHRDGIEYTVLGTAHVSKNSAEEVKRLINENDFDVVAIELCDARYQSLTGGDQRWRQMDLFDILRQRKAGLLMASLALGAYQRRLADQFGIEPGAEMVAAIQASKDTGAQLQIIDRDLNTTLKRVYSSIPFWRRFVLFSGLVASMFSKDEISEEDIENLKQGDILESTFSEFAEQSPEIFHSLIAERDEYMASRLRLLNSTSTSADEDTNEDKKVLVVIGAGHMAGMNRYLTDDQQDPQTTIDRLDTLPKPAKWPKIIPWLISALVISGFAIGFSRQPELGWKLVGLWVIINGTFSALGTAIARGHPLTILSAFIAAPLTSLNPAVGAGMVTGLVEAWIRKLKVEEFEKLRDDVTSIKGWFRNPVTRVLLVFFFAQLGSAIGTWVAGYQIFSALS